MNPHDPTPAEGSPPADGFTIDALMAGHALGDLDPAEREQLAALLRKRPELGQRLEEFHTTLKLLPLALPATAPPPRRLRQRLLMGLDPAARDGGRKQPGAGSAVGTWLVPALLGAALLGMGVQLQQTRQQLARLEQHVMARGGIAPAPASEGRRMLLKAVDPAWRASGEVMVTGNATHNVLMLNDLPPPPPQHVYRLWASVDGHKVGCVAFVPTEQGHVAMLIPPMPTSVATSVSVSVESDQVGESPRGREVLSSSI